MLRSLVLILLLVNAAFFAWSRGWLNELVGVRPDAQHEPQRLAQQIHPDRIVVPPRTSDAISQPDSASSPAQADGDGTTPAQEAAASAPEPAPSEPGAEPAGEADATANPASQPPSAPAPPAPAARPETAIAAASAARPGKALCVEAGPFSAAEYASAESMLRTLLPSGVWTKQTVAIQGMWLVYMGPYAEADQLQRKQDELKRIKELDFEVVRTPANLAPGISLGRFSKKENADNQLEILKDKGIRTARIVNLRPPQELQLLRIARADVDTQVKLSSLKLPQGKGFTACRR